MQLPTGRLRVHVPAGKYSLGLDCVPMVASVTLAELTTGEVTAALESFLTEVLLVKKYVVVEETF